MQQLATGIEPVMEQPVITRLEQMYVITKLEQGQYVYYNQNTKKFSPKDQAFYAELERVSRFLAASPYLLDEITAKISQEDGTVLQDLLHTIELGDYRAYEGLALLKDLRASRKKRRYYKDRQQAVNYLLTKTNVGQVNTTSDKAQVALTKLGDLRAERNYNYRNSGLQAKYAKLLGKQPVQRWVQLFRRLRKRWEIRAKSA